ncbi:hypothetical protein M885DRAFT_404013, partial [Pelagophyceae sp. CCMP2097]
GTVGLVAPECVLKREYRAAADVFSLGVIVFILLMGYAPFHGADDAQVLSKTAQGDYRIEADDWTAIDPRASELVSAML